MKSYLLRVLIALDILVMATLNGKRNETLSAAAWSLYKDQKWQGALFVPVLDWLMEKLGDGPEHCRRTWVSENLPGYEK